MFAHGWQTGGGLYIFGTATLTDTNVFKNQADWVRSPVEPSLSSHPAPRRNITRAHGWQEAGGLYIFGMAMLTDTNVHENEAGMVCSPVEPSCADCLLSAGS